MRTYLGLLDLEQCSGSRSIPAAAEMGPPANLGVCVHYVHAPGITDPGSFATVGVHHVSPEDEAGVVVERQMACTMGKTGQGWIHYAAA